MSIYLVLKNIRGYKFKPTNISKPSKYTYNCIECGTHEYFKQEVYQLNHIDILIVRKRYMKESSYFRNEYFFYW